MSDGEAFCLLVSCIALLGLLFEMLKASDSHNKPDGE
jgi:hypothetical protein